MGCQNRFFVIAFIFLIVALFLTKLFSKVSILHKEQKESRTETACVDMSTFGMFSWGFSQNCCDIYPSSIVVNCGFEGGDVRDDSYFKLNKVKQNGAHQSTVVYISTSDFPEFLTTFLKLSASTRIILVTGLEDIGVPWELWGNGRNNINELWNKTAYGKPVISFQQFILDKRLLHWYTQNYDLVGCNIFTCSSIKANDTIVKKITPIPIGVDFHSRVKRFEGNEMGYYRKNDLRKDSKAFCDQHFEMTSLIARLPSFSQRPLRLSADFACSITVIGAKEISGSRQDLCNAIIQYGASSNLTISKRNTRRKFWNNMGTHAFSLAPPGHGMDTHRAWEILQLHSVPIVITSPLDRLYVQFPVIIVKNWTDVFKVDALSNYKIAITKRFGVNPFDAKMITKLSIGYWNNLVKST
jgi:hypothetical protein